MKQAKISFKTSAFPALLFVMFFLFTSSSHVIKANQHKRSLSEISMTACKGPVVTSYKFLQNVTHREIMPARQCGCWQWFAAVTSGISNYVIAISHPDSPKL